MSQHCPICRTPIWTDVVLAPSRLRCPRCGAEFRPTVSLSYLRILLLIILILILVLVLQVSDRGLSALVFLISLGLLLWFLPRIIDLQQISPKLVTGEALPAATHSWKGNDKDWPPLKEGERMRAGLPFWAYLLVLLLIAALVLMRVLSPR